MRQYLEWKSRYPDAILMFRLGDFYEMFYEDAVLVAQELDLTLTTRDKGKENPVPMCGVPHHTLETYVARLVELGHKVAICDQMESPAQAKGIVRREVTRVVTPGVILDLDHLDARRPNYLAALWPEADGVGLALADVSTGELRVTAAADMEALEAELARTGPREILVPEERADGLEACLPDRAVVQRVPAPSEDPGPVRQLLTEPESVSGLSGRQLRAVAMIAEYVRSTLPSGALPPLRLVSFGQTDYMVLDEATLAHLEVFSALMTGKREGSLLAAVDRTVTPMGGRALRQALAYPLQDLREIGRRQDAVQQLLEAGALRAQLRSLLKKMGDLERLARRLGHRVAGPRDLAALRRSLELLPDLARLLGQVAPDRVRALGLDLSLLDLGEDLLEDLAARLGEALVDEPPATLKDGGVFRPGYDEELDRLVDLSRGGKDRILAIEERERARTGIASLKVKYNKVFGYYIEVTKANLSQVPGDYTRKQTLANAERFVTPELAELEALVLEAEEKRKQREQELFSALVEELAGHTNRIAAAARRVALVDLLASFAEQAASHDYCRPELVAEPVFEMEEGRHPVVEQFLPHGSFVPNDVHLDARTEQLLVVTGPNMAGKSTIIRQVALITLLAHTGSYVPARRAVVGLTDRIFTRVGASDNLARGESTFMVEMRETARILRQATARSLVILDEIGRGTSTFDGMARAWAVAEYLHDRVRARTLFATHYHELCGLAEFKPRVRNYAVTVKEWQDDIVFLHKLVPGAANRSYGIQVAKLAGLPEAVIRRAVRILNLLERSRKPMGQSAQLDLFELLAARRAGGGSHGAGASRPGAEAPPPPGDASGQELPDGVRRLVERLRSVRPDDVTPRQAHELLYELRALVEKWDPRDTT